MNEGELFSVHLIDQASEALATLAQVIGRYFKELIKNDLPEDLAGDLVLQYQDRLLDGMPNANSSSS